MLEKSKLKLNYQRYGDLLGHSIDLTEHDMSRVWTDARSEISRYQMEDVTKTRAMRHLSILLAACSAPASL